MSRDGRFIKKKGIDLYVLILNMTKSAVKFGRMSKKQRERVEDEANQIRMRSSSNNISSPNGIPDYSNITSISQSGNNNDFYTAYSLIFFV